VRDQSALRVSLQSILTAFSIEARLINIRWISYLQLRP
jgi:hypothetical protein